MYTPELVSGLMFKQRRLGVRELFLHDIDPERLELIGGLARMLERGVPAPSAFRSARSRLLGLVQHVAAYERLAANAARTGDRRWARVALMAHPLVREYRLADDMFEPLLRTEARPAAPPEGQR
jgi:alpha-galactosidase/6-phospho-beta-glucosidase family protein